MISKDVFKFYFENGAWNHQRNRLILSILEAQGNNSSNFGPKSKSRISMEGQDQYQAACMNRKGPTNFKCPKKLIEQKVQVYTGCPRKNARLCSKSSRGHLKGATDTVRWVLKNSGNFQSNEHQKCQRNRASTLATLIMK